MGICLMKGQWLWLLYVLLIHIVINNIEAISPDGEALINFRTAITDSDGILLQWMPEDPDPCKWKGVKCDPKTKRVTHLILSSHNLIGSLSPDLGKLEHLKVIDLHFNNLYGIIPPELGNCTELQGIFLQNNYLQGVIPSEIGNLPQLQNLDISNNLLTVNIPVSIGKLYNLKNFNVSANFLVGPISSDGVPANFTGSS